MRAAFACVGLGLGLGGRRAPDVLFTQAGRQLVCSASASACFGELRTSTGKELLDRECQTIFKRGMITFGASRETGKYSNTSAFACDQAAVRQEGRFTHACGPNTPYGALPLSTATGEGTNSSEEDAKTEAEAEAEAETENGGEGDEIREKLLQTSMEHVTSLGFTMQAMQAAGRDLGYSRAVANIFPREEFELIEYFLDDCRAKMNAELEERKEEIGEMRVSQKIAEAVRIRLRLVAPYIHVWPKVIFTMSQPQNTAESLCQLHHLMDDMWHHAGDRSTDLNWYSKRMLLAGVYTSSELFMLTDSSPDFEETWHYVDRSIGRVLKLGKAGNDLLSMFKNFAESGNNSNKTTRV